MKMTYDEAVLHLLEKYGGSTVDYFSELSYDRFLKGKNKAPYKRKQGRSLEGLYCHHIDENKFGDMSNKEAILLQNIPFDYQRKERLVFCDLIEHGILHALIMKETDLTLGNKGYFFARDIIKDWYIFGERPVRVRWLIACCSRAYLTPEEAFNMVKEIDRIILSIPIPKDLEPDWEEDLIFRNIKYFPSTFDDMNQIINKKKTG